MRVLSSLLFFLLVSLGFSHIAGQAPTFVSLTPSVTLNGVVKSVIVPQTGAAVLVKHFLGVAFAQPPVGPLRFAPPLTPNYPANVDASQYAPGCKQPGIPSSEDCLYLNVWVPNTAPPAGGFPVIHYIHGGGFLTGSGSEIDGAQLVAANSSVIVVASNYRLGLFGYLSIAGAKNESSMLFGTEIPTTGASGLLDQRAALQWTQSYISKFGGDANKVTVAGESAGSISVCAHLVSPLSTGLFSRAILESGSCDGPVGTVTQAYQNTDLLFTQISRIFGKCTSSSASDSSINSLNCLRSLSADDLLTAAGAMGSFNFFGPTAFGPVVDGYFLRDYPVNTLSNAPTDGIAYNKVDLLTMYLADEMSLFVFPNSPFYNASAVDDTYVSNYCTAVYGANGPKVFTYLNTTYPGNSVQQLKVVAGGNTFTCPVRRLARLYSSGGRRVFHSVWQYASPYSTFKSPVHSSELSYVWSQALTNTGAPWINLTYPADAQASSLVQSYFLNFIQNGDPNVGSFVKAGAGVTTLPTWPLYTTASDATLVFLPNATAAASTGLSKSDCDLLDSVRFAPTVYVGESTVSTTTFGAVRGIIRDNTRQYRSIPYAQAPTGSLRYASPFPAKYNTKNVLDATTYRPSCISPTANSNRILDGATFIGAEDCLHATITTPLITPAGGNVTGLPVLVYIDGGAYSVIDNSAVDPTQLVNARGDTIVVHFSYRTGALGWLAHPALSFARAVDTGSKFESSGNYGFEDVLFLLKWVQSNIAQFGGNPSQVTIYGTHTGGSLVCGLLVSPNAAGLFQRAISSSSACYTDYVNSLADSENTGLRIISNAVAAYNQANPNVIPADVLSYLLSTDPATVVGNDMKVRGAAAIKRIPVSFLVRAAAIVTDNYNAFLPFLDSPSVNFLLPTVDGALIPDYPYRLLRSGTFNKVDVLLGANYADFMAFIGSNALLPFTPSINSTVLSSIFARIAPTSTSSVQTSYTGRIDLDITQQVALATSDAFTTCQVRRLAETVSATNNAYLFNFKYVSQSSAFANYSNGFGALTGNDEVYINSKPDGVYASKTVSPMFPAIYAFSVIRDGKMSDIIQTYFARFIKDGSISSGVTVNRYGPLDAEQIPTWPAYASGTGFKGVTFDATNSTYAAATVSNDFSSLCRSLWDIQPLPNATIARRPLASVPVIQTANGAVSGKFSDSTIQYLGIPFARPPVGALRWASPVPAMNWTGTYDASFYRNVCYQPNLRTGGITGDEDCLYLNVFVPIGPAPKGGFPVLVYIYGGGFATGSSNENSPHMLVNANQNIIAVTINYRVGVFGFFAHPFLSWERGQLVGTESSGNYGIEDQVLALKWVNTNIAAFGGNPTQVTIGGESAGAISCCLLVNLPQAAGLFQRAIIMSGGCDNSNATLTDAEKVGVSLLQATTRAVDSSSTLPSAVYQILMNTAPATSDNYRQGLEFMRRFPSIAFLGGASAIDAFFFFGTTALNPFVDGYVVPDFSQKLYASGRTNKVQLLIGSANTEMLYFVQPQSPWPIFRNITANIFDQFSKQYAPGRSDIATLFSQVSSVPQFQLISFFSTLFNCPTRRFAKSMANYNTGDNVYFYGYDYYSAASKFAPFAVHSSELAYFFSSPSSYTDFTAANADGGFTYTKDRQLSNIFQTYALRFITTGNPNNPSALVTRDDIVPTAQQLPFWTPYNATSRNALRFTSGTTDAAIAVTADPWAICEATWDTMTYQVPFTPRPPRNLDLPNGGVVPSSTGSAGNSSSTSSSSSTAGTQPPPYSNPTGTYNYPVNGSTNINHMFNLFNLLFAMAMAVLLM